MDAGARAVRRGPLTRKQILEASLRLFSGKGFARTTVRDIARDVGITDAAIYYHFSSKQELLEAIVEEKGFIEHLQNLEQVSPTVPLRECLMTMARRAVEIMDANRDFLRLMVLEGLAGDKVMNAQYRRLLDRWERALSSLLERFRAQGEPGLEGVDTGQLARQVIYVILGAFLDSLMGRYPGTDGSPEARCQALASFAAETIGGLLSGRR